MKLSLDSLSNYQKLFLKEFSFQFIEKIIRIIVGVYVIRELSKYLGVVNFGVYNFIESYFLIIMALSLFGLDVIMVRQLEGNKRYNKVLGNGIYILSFTSLIFIIISVFLGTFIVTNENYINILIVSLGLIFSPLVVFESYYISLNKIRITSFFKIIAFTIKSILIIYFISKKYSFNYFIFIIISEYLLSGIFILLYFIKEQNQVSFKIDLSIIKEILGSSFYVLIYSLGALVFIRIDLFMIENFLSSYEMGIYTASFKIISFSYFIPNIIAQTLYPRIIEIFKSKKLELKPLKKMYKLSFITGLFVFILLLAMGDYIIDFLYGSQFTDSKYILKILSFNILLISISSVYYKVLYSSNLEKRLFFRILVAIALNIILNIVLIPIYKLEGVAFATIISLFFLEFVYDFFDKKLIDSHIFKLKSLIKF